MFYEKQSPTSSVLIAPSAFELKLNDLKEWHTITPRKVELCIKVSE
jgi:hypothetical protein